MTEMTFTRQQLKDMAAEQLLPKIPVLQRSFLVFVLNRITDEDAANLGAVIAQIQPMAAAGDRDGLRKFFQRFEVPAELVDWLIDLVVEHARVDDPNPSQ